MNYNEKLGYYCTDDWIITEVSKYNWTTTRIDMKKEKGESIIILLVDNEIYYSRKTRRCRVSPVRFDIIIKGQDIINSEFSFSKGSNYNYKTEQEAIDILEEFSKKYFTFLLSGYNE